MRATAAAAAGVVLVWEYAAVRVLRIGLAILGRALALAFYSCRRVPAKRNTICRRRGPLLGYNLLSFLGESGLSVVSPVDIYYSFRNSCSHGRSSLQSDGE